MIQTTITRCKDDKLESVKIALLSTINIPYLFASARQEHFVLSPYYTIRPTESEIVQTNGVKIIIQSIKSAQLLGLEPKDIQESIVSIMLPYLDFDKFVNELIFNLNAEPEIVGSILLIRSVVLIDYFIRLCEFAYSRKADQRLDNFRLIPISIAKKDNNLAAMWVWAQSHCLKNPHYGIEALSKLSIDSPFFRGFDKSLEGMMHYNSEKCLSGLILIKSDLSIHHDLINYFVKKIEIEAKKLRDVAATEPGVKIEQLHVGDVVSGAKIGSQIEINDSVVNRSNIGGTVESVEPQTKKFCSDCGCKIGSPSKFCPECGCKL